MHVGIFKNVLRFLPGALLQFVSMSVGALLSGMVGMQVQLCGFRKHLVPISLFENHRDRLFDNGEDS